MLDFLTFLQENPYPGRGILVSRDLVYYFIMGRSANSRNRIFVKTEDGIRTEAHDPAKLEDPSLIIYHPVRTMGDALVVTNGDQTDTICQHGDFRKGLMTREYEPDEPNWTPRISAILNADGSFEMSILKHKNGRCLREFFCYEGCDENQGYFISTYQGDGSLGRSERRQQGVPLYQRERRGAPVQQKSGRLRRRCRNERVGTEIWLQPQPEAVQGLYAGRL